MKRIIIIALTVVFVLSFSIIAFAGQTNQGAWRQDSKGWWWQFADGTYPTSSWWWIDDNNDGVYQSYYFGNDGYMLRNTTTPDGYTVNADGAWVVNGQMQQKNAGLVFDKSRATSYPTDIGVTIGNSEADVLNALISNGIQYERIDNGYSYWDKEGASHLYMFINGTCVTDSTSFSGNYDTIRALFEYYVQDSSQMQLIDSTNNIDEMRYRYSYLGILERDIWMRNLGNGLYSLHHTWWLAAGF